MNENPPITSPSDASKKPRQIALNISNRYAVAIDLAVLAATAAFAYFYNWSSTDLIWSLWLSSLLIGYLTLLLGSALFPTMMIFGAFAKGPQTPKQRLGLFCFGLIIGAFLIGFFSIHFLGFHAVHGTFLYSFFPLTDIPKEKSGFITEVINLKFIGALWLAYWPFVIATAVSQWKKYFGGAEKFSMMDPYKNVIKIHFMIFVFAGLQFLKVDNFIFYVAILIVFFAPWNAFTKPRHPAGTTTS